MIRISVIAALLAILAGCAHVVLSDYAQTCRIIKASHKDTPETLKAVLAENNKCRDAVRAEAPTR